MKTRALVANSLGGFLRIGEHCDALYATRAVGSEL